MWYDEKTDISHFIEIDKTEKAESYLYKHQDWFQTRFQTCTNVDHRPQEQPQPSPKDRGVFESTPSTELAERYNIRKSVLGKLTLVIELVVLTLLY